MDWAAWWQQWNEVVWGGVVGVVVTVLFGYVFYRLAEKPKRLSWEVLNKNRIIHASADQRMHLKVMFRDQEVADPNITILRIGNTGKQPVVAEDFKGEPISIDFGDVRILAHEISDRSMPEMTGSFTVDAGSPGKVRFLADYFNLDDWIDLQFVTDGELRNPKISARFVGQTAPVEDIRLVKVVPRKFYSLIFSGLMVVGVVFGGWNMFIDPSNPDTVRGWIGAICLLALIVGSFVTSVFPRRALWKGSRHRSDTMNLKEVLAE